MLFLFFRFLIFFFYFFHLFFIFYFFNVLHAVVIALPVALLAGRRPVRFYGFPAALSGNGERSRISYLELRNLYGFRSCIG